MAVWKESTRATNPLTVLSTTLANLAADAAVLSTAAITNSATSDERDFFGDFELLGAMATAPTDTGGRNLEYRVVRTLDGTNFEDDSTDGEPELGFVGSFIVPVTTNVFRKVIPMVMLPPLDFKGHLINKTTATLQNTTGNVLSAYIYTQE